MTPAGKMHILTEIYNQGLLCKCKRYDKEKEIIKHRKDCKAIAKMIKLGVK